VRNPVGALRDEIVSRVHSGRLGRTIFTVSKVKKEFPAKIRLA